MDMPSGSADFISSLFLILSILAIIGAAVIWAGVSAFDYIEKLWRK